MYDSASISRIVVETELQANDIVAQLGRGADFAQLAREASIDGETRDSGGQAGNVQRRVMEPSLAAGVFSANEGDVIGPLAIGSGFQVARVEHVKRAVLDDDTAEEVRDQLFAAWLEQRSAEQIEFNLGSMVTGAST